MYRHSKDLPLYVSPSEYIDEHPYPYHNSLITHQRLTVDTGLDSVNTSLDSSLFVADGSSVHFASGFLPLGQVNLGKDFTFMVFVYAAGNIPLFSIDNQFDVVYDNSNLIFRRRLFDTTFESISIPFSIDINTWTHLTIVRKNNIINLYKNLELVVTFDFLYSIPEGIAYFGRNYNASQTYTGNASLLSLHSEALDVNYLNLEGLTRNILMTDVYGKYSVVQQLLDKEYISNSLIYRNQQSTYNADKKCWLVYPNGLSIEADTNLFTNSSYTAECAFELTNPSSNIMIFGYWYGGISSSYYIYYNLLSNSYKLVLRESQIEEYNICSYLPGLTYMAVQISDNAVQVYVNGKLQLDINVSINKPLYYKQQFNFNVDGILNSANVVKIYNFTAHNQTRYTKNYLPFIYQHSNLFYKFRLSKLNYHAVEYNTKYSYNIINSFTVTGVFEISPGETKTYTISQNNIFNEPSIYTLKFISSDELSVNDVIIPLTVIIPANAITASFDVTFPTAPYNAYKQSFSIEISNSSYSQTIDINIVDNRDYLISQITSIPGYLDGYLAINSTVDGYIPNLTGTNTATTSASKVTTLHGQAYNLENQAIILPSSVSDIQTVITVYRELNPVENRSYIGDSIEYTFNGGLSGELVGNLVLEGSDYTKAFETSGIYSKVAISGNDSVIVAVANSGVFVYEKINGIWQSSPTQLNLDLQDNNTSNASVSINQSGTKISLGFPEANQGEGVVQIWSKDSVWLKELHLGSPVPAPYTGGFGYSVDLSDDGTRLFVAQIGNGTVYVFDKTVTWSTMPSATLTESASFGFNLSCNGEGTAFAATDSNSNVYIYEYNNSWNLVYNAAFGLNCAFAKNSMNVVVSNYVNKEVRLYTKFTNWELAKTITSLEEDFGYSVAISDNLNILVGNPTENKAYLYLESNSYETPSSFSSGYSVSSNNTTLVLSDYSSSFTVSTQNADALPQKIVYVRQNKTSVSLDTILDISNPQILTFISNIPMRADKIGGSKIETSLNGLWFGTLLFSSVLTVSELEQLEEFLTQYLGLDRYGIYVQ